MKQRCPEEDRRERRWVDCALREKVIYAGILTHYGRDAAAYAGAQYAKETGLRKEGCLSVISRTNAPDAVPELKGLMKSPDPKLRHAAVNALATIGTPDAEQILESAKSDPYEPIQTFARHQLYRRNASKHKDEFKRTLSGSDAKEQLAVLRIVATNPSADMVPDLEEFLRKDEKSNPNDPTLRFYAAKAIWKASGKKIEYERGASAFKPYPWDN